MLNTHFDCALILHQLCVCVCVQEAVADTLEELWISYNLIEKLKGIQSMKNLRVLYMSNNLVKEWGKLFMDMISHLIQKQPFWASCNS